MTGGAKRILVVDDEIYVLKALEGKFASEGFEVIAAQDGEEGLQKAIKEHPDLIIADIIMPKLDGISMLKKIREDSWGKDAKVIMLTNLNPEDKIIKDLTEAQPAFYLMKVDTRLEEIIEKAKEVLG